MVYKFNYNPIQMKSANFNYSDPKGGRTIYGSVTLKDDGKISISLQDSKFHSGYTVNCAKRLANEIVAADFNHPSARDVKKSNTNLIEILKTYTKELKEEYIEKVRIYEDANFDKKLAYSNTIPQKSTEKWFSFFGIEFRMTSSRSFSVEGIASVVEYPVPVRYEGKYRKTTNSLEALKTYLDNGKEKAIAVAVKHAEDHYRDSLEKLAYRIEQKGLKVSEMKVSTARIGINLEITLTDGVETVKAWTIWAEGEINTPHFRYLVK